MYGLKCNGLIGIVFSCYFCSYVGMFYIYIYIQYITIYFNNHNLFSPEALAANQHIITIIIINLLKIQLVIYI